MENSIPQIYIIVLFDAKFVLNSNSTHGEMIFNETVANMIDDDSKVRASAKMALPVESSNSDPYFLPKITRKFTKSNLHSVKLKSVPKLQKLSVYDLHVAVTSHILPFYAPIPVKSLPQVKFGKIALGSNIAHIYIWTFCIPICLKITKI